MKKVYLDEKEAHECISIFIKDVEIIHAGTTVYSMPVKDKNSEYERFADEYDIHFIFDDDIPPIDFYTIPQVDIMATDSKGGFIGTIGQKNYNGVTFYNSKADAEKVVEFVDWNSIRYVKEL